MRHLPQVILGLLLAWTPLAWAGTVGLQDEAGAIEWGNAVIKCSGAGISCAKSGITATLTVSGGGGAGSGTVTTTKEGGVQVGDADIAILDFGAGFDLAESPDTEINFTLDGSEVFTGGDLSWSGNTPTIAANAVALTTDTTGNYAAGDAEAGDALAGDTATAFFDAGTIEHERGGLEADVSAYDGLIGITGGATYNQTGTTTQIIIFDGAGAPTSAALSGDVTMTNAGVVSIGSDKITEAMLKAVDAAVDEDILTRETTTGDFEWHTGAELCVEITGSADLCDGSDDGAGGVGGDNLTVNSSAVDTTGNLLDGDVDFTLVDGGAGGPDDITATVACSGCIDATDLATDSVSADELNATGVEAELEAALDIGGEVTSTGMASTVIADSVTVTGWVLGTSSATALTVDTEAYDATGWNGDNTVPTKDAVRDKIETLGAGSDTNAVKEYWFPASSLEPLEADESIPPLSKWTGTNTDTFALSYDASTDEGRKVVFKVPSDVQSGSTITFRFPWFARTATTGDVIWDARCMATGAEGESWDNTLTTEAAAADAVQGTTNLMTVTTVTETLANLGWAANDVVTCAIYRDANAAGDTMADDAQLLGVGIEIPRA